MNLKAHPSRYVTLLALTMLFLFAACQPAQPETSVLDTQEQVLGFAAISAISTLEHQQSTPQAIQETRFNAQDVDAYLDLIKTFMGDDNSFSVRVDNSTFDSYQYTMYITTADITGSREVHEFHYNETITEIDEDEVESIIRGVMSVGGVEYQLYGEREIESGEESLELVARIDDENYVTVDYEFERDGSEVEKEFKYERFVDNQLVYRTEIKFEKEDGETELTLKFLRGTYESEYDFEIETEGDEQTIEIDYKISENGIVLEEGEYEVLIINGQAVEYRQKTYVRHDDSLLRLCPDEWYDNQMPGIIGDDNPPVQYFVIDGKRRELAEFDVEWVVDNCDVNEPTVVV